MIGSHTGTPRSYLTQFARTQSPSDRKRKLWVYQRGVRPFKATPYRVGKENGYFAAAKASGGRDESMEKILAALETKSAELLPLLNYETYVLSQRDEETLVGHVALTFARTNARRGLTAKILDQIRDAYKELAADPIWLEEQAQAFEGFSGVVTTPGEISAATGKVLEKLAKPEHANDGFVQGLLRLAEGIFRDLRGKPWQIWEAPEPMQFITTDNPVITLKADTWGAFTPGWGFRTPGVTTIFPISPSRCFVIGESVGAGRRYWRRATARDVNGVNKGLIACMDRWAYSAAFSQDIEWLVNNLGGSVTYGVNAFVPAWIDNASEHIKAGVREATSLAAAKIGARSVRPETAGINTKRNRI